MLLEVWFGDGINTSEKYNHKTLCVPSELLLSVELTWTVMLHWGHIFLTIGLISLIQLFCYVNQQNQTRKFIA